MFAQSTTASIETPPIVKVDAGSETALPIKVTPAGGALGQAMVLIRGIPSGARLSEGRNFASGVWAVKPSVAEDLRIVTSPDTNEDTPLVISLVALDGEYLGNVLSRLVITPGATSAEATEKAEQIPAMRYDATNADVEVTAELGKETNATVAAAPRGNASLRTLEQALPLELSRGDIEKILKLMQKGDQYLFEGKIAAARRFYEYAAEMGWPDGAAAIGRTYDPNHLNKFSILGGIEPDSAQAKRWYDKARELSKRIEVDVLQRTGQR